MWGWSYGGYISGLLLAKDNKISDKSYIPLTNEDEEQRDSSESKLRRLVACAIAVAPVSEWHQYGKTKILEAKKHTFLVFC